MAKIWLLTDDRAGNVNQLLGIAEALGEPWERKEIRYNRWVRLPNLLRGAGLIGIDALSRAGLTPPWPDVVLAAGRRAFPVARYIRRQSGGRTRIVQVMNPGRAGWREADLIVLPAHDDYRGHDARVMTVVGAPHRVSREKLRAERAVWEPRFQAYPHKRVALIVGGATKDKPFPETAAQNQKHHAAGDQGEHAHRDFRHHAQAKAEGQLHQRSPFLPFIPQKRVVQNGCHEHDRQ